MGFVDGWAVLNAIAAIPNGPWTIAGLALLGAIIGSYLATIALRWPEGRSATSGRSACDGCGAALRWFELFPIVSFLTADGHCRRCGAAITPLHLGVEIAAAMLGALAAAVMPTLGGAIALATLCWQLLLLAVLDYQHFWLPDRLTLLLAVSGLLLGGLVGDAPLLDRAIAMVGAFAALEILRRAFRMLRGEEGMGAGDPKLLAAIAAWTGPIPLPFILLTASALGLGVALLLAAKKRPTPPFPFGTLLAVATISVTAFGL